MQLICSVLFYPFHSQNTAILNKLLQKSNFSHKIHDRTHVYAFNSVIKSNIPTSSNSNISSSTPLLQQQLQHNQLLFQQQQQLQLQQAQQQQQQISSHSLSTQQLINQSKDIIRTHEDYIRCKAWISIISCVRNGLRNLLKSC